MKIIIVLVAAFYLAGCASIVSKSSYPVTVDSSPSGATFTITNKAGQTVQAGTTPQVVTLDPSPGYFKKESFEITVSKAGFEDRAFTLTPSVDGWYWGNILIGGLLGMLVVDPITGAMYKLPDSVNVPLDGSPVALDHGDLEIAIASIDALTDEERMRLEAIN